jgi:diacylglycerol kinase (ATP)
MVPMKVLLVRNPVAGQRDIDDDLSRVLAYLEGRGWDVSSRATERQGHATALAREAADEGYDMVVAVGGDGTIGEVATGLVGSATAMGVLPVGTGNLWARMLELPVWSPVYRSALMDAARILVEGDRRPIDVGRAHERYFVMWSGIGFDAQVARDVEPYRDIRRSLGNLTYLATAVAEALFMRGTRTTVVVDGRAKRYRVVLILVANAQLYGPSIRLAPHVYLDDGLLDVYIFRGSNLLDVVRHLYMLLTGRHASSPSVDVFKAKQVYIVADSPLPTHLDGDPSVHTPITIRVVPRALMVVVPRWASASLFEHGPAASASEVSLSARLARGWHDRQERWSGSARGLQGDARAAPDQRDPGRQ